jgi:ATP/maltotriose-dependent transcriptional regulator MalT
VRRVAVPKPKRVFELTEREQEVARLVAAGLTNRQVATRLGVSYATAKYHAHNINSKLPVLDADANW